MGIEKTKKIVKKLETQLKTTSRQLVQFNTEEDTLQYICDSFREKLSADFVGIIVKMGNQLSIKSWSGADLSLTEAFPISIDRCSPSLFSYSKTYEEIKQETDCEINQLLLKEKVPTWFTVPLKNELGLFGFCIIGFFQKVKLYTELQTIFDEFGKDVAIAMLYQREKQHKQELQLLLNYQQTLVKETLDGDSIEGITESLSNLLSCSVILMDRFMRPISYKLVVDQGEELQLLVELATYEIVQKHSKKLWGSTHLDDQRQIAVWPIDVGGDLLGYLVIDITPIKVNDYFQLSIDVARNIYSVQFMKQKLVLDTKEQVKDSFISKLLTEHIEDLESIFRYANLFNWDIRRPHFVAILAFTLVNDSTFTILEKEAYKSRLWERLKSNITIYYPEVQIINKSGEIILISPESDTNPKSYWSKFYEDVKKWISREAKDVHVCLAIGGKTKKITDYYRSYLEAVKTLNVVKVKFKDYGFALFDELGAYTLLHQIDLQMVMIFINKHLLPLLKYEGTNMDLYHTLHMYLQYNGNIKETSEVLYIHRSTLQYRLERIESILNVELNSSEDRFNLMMAIKLYDLFRDELAIPMERV